MEKKSTLNALVRLLDDPDPQVYRHVRARLLSYGYSIWDDLQLAIYQAPGEVARCRLEHIMDVLHLQHIRQLLMGWKTDKQQDLLWGMLLLAQHYYPHLDCEKVNKQIHTIRKDAWLELNDSLTAMEQIKVLNQVFFQMHGFCSTNNAPFATKELYINDILSNKRGATLMNNVFYAILAKKLDLPIYLVQLPDMFFLAYLNTPNHKHITRKDVLFYFSTSEPGNLLSYQDILRMLRYMQIYPDEKYFIPCSTSKIMQGMLDLLSEQHSYMNHTAQAKGLQELSSLFKER